MRNHARFAPAKEGGEFVPCPVAKREPKRPCFERMQRLAPLLLQTSDNLLHFVGPLFSLFIILR